MNVSTEGVIKGRKIELDRETGLPEGARVRVLIEVPPKTIAQKRQLLASLAGSCKQDPTFAEAVLEIERQRSLSIPREVDLDVAS